MSQAHVEDIYDSYIDRLREANEVTRYAGRSEWFHASSSGLCTRKIYFQSIENAEPSPRDKDSLRLFRLGDLVHTDIQTAVTEYARETGARVLIEKEIVLPKLGVRGFLDLALLDDSHLIDIKTCNSYKWKNMFGKNAPANTSKNYALQLGTYGMFIDQNYEHLKKLSLLFYNKNTSQMREVEFSRSIMLDAEIYWHDVNEKFEDGLPPIHLGEAPAYGWECNPKYCSFFEHCGGGLKPELL